MATLHLGLAEYVSSNPDGTVTVHRGWMTLWKVNALPANLSLYALIAAEGLPVGATPFVATMHDPSGAAVARYEGLMTTKADEVFAGGFPLRLVAAREGSYVLTISSDAGSGSTRLRVEVTR